MLTNFRFLLIRDVFVFSVRLSILSFEQKKLMPYSIYLKILLLSWLFIETDNQGTRIQFANSQKKTFLIV
jgi:hypothetical protein